MNACAESSAIARIAWVARTSSACLDALRVDEREREVVAIERDHLEILRFTQQVGNALTDESGADEGNFHVHLLVVQSGRHTFMPQV